ncbi:cupin domain-containing protein [Dyadobacter flavalbus]|uniref:Cupin domain-containing protein n=1 Tax=Dyadobacter flavalbus TaxID=2579942 RepID=A0A5M8Q9B8_9BACT|nr:cupin domain-containing protein [Dyadobacter flavalbus]KAA6431456.1 cupin domain-containing protein [Dyadobacter flavalbus]
MSILNIKPETFLFSDDGKIPNSKFPLVVYRNAFSERGVQGAAWIEERFESNKWTNSWRNGVFSYHHYHSISHEVLAVYAGNALLHMGGEKGKKMTVHAGDILIIPTGVGHKKLDASADFAVVGAYPNGSDYDILRGEPGDRPKAQQNIARVPLPELDPLYGKNGELLKIWI